MSQWLWSIIIPTVATSVLWFGCWSIKKHVWRNYEPSDRRFDRHDYVYLATVTLIIFVQSIAAWVI